jgi:lysophospholipase L1-like esterase
MNSAARRPAWATPSLCACVWALGACHPADAAPAEIHEIDVSGLALQSVSVPVPEGNYQVTVHLQGPKGTRVALLAEQRRLMAEDIELQGARPVERTVIVNVRRPELGALPDNATGGSMVRLKAREIGSASWDDRLSVELRGGGEFRSLRALPANLPTLYLAGDSTVTDQAAAPAGSWGQFLTRYFRGDIAVANHAESGESLKSFVTGHRLDKLLSRLSAGDWVMIQFGHNDQKQQWPQTFTDAANTYRAWLRTYVAEIRRRGATPLLVTSPERRHFDANGQIVPTLGAYPDAVRAVALEERVALLDLNSMSVKLYEALGPEASPRAFADEGRDKTHHNEYGARQLARCVIEAIRRADPALTAGLERHIAADAGRYDPSQPDPLPAP